MNVYERRPEIQNEHFLFRLVNQEDCDDLLKVYSDEKSVPLFNSDNCNGDTFFYQTRERMMQAIDFWLYAYQAGAFVRWSIIDRRLKRAVGTIEVFLRVSEDAFTNTVLLRLDLRGDYKQADALSSILSVIMKQICPLFECDSITTKVPPHALVRRAVLSTLGFAASAEPLIGHDGTHYGNYFVYRQNA